MARRPGGVPDMAVLSRVEEDAVSTGSPNNGGCRSKSGMA